MLNRIFFWLAAVLLTRAAFGLNPCSLAILADRGGQIRAKVPKLYESVPGKRRLEWQSMTLVNEPDKSPDKYRAVISLLNGRARQSYSAEYRYEPKSKSLTLNSIHLRPGLYDNESVQLPTWTVYPGARPLDSDRPERGMPTSLFLNLNFMRWLKIPAGGLKSFHLDRVENGRTRAELYHLIGPSLQESRGVPKKAVAQVFLQTTMGRLAENIAVQSGHRIRSVAVRGGRMDRFVMPEGGWFRYNDDVFRSLVQGVPPDARSPEDFFVDFELEPAQP